MQKGQHPVNSLSIDIRRAASRFLTRTSWLTSWHSFSFSHHYDPRNTRFGLLVVSNDDIIQPETGFGMHPHQDMEIVTWVLEGELEHQDNLGNKGVIYPGLAQRMSAGTGIWHSEMNPSRDRPVRLVQMWVLPDTQGIPPSYEQRDIAQEMTRGGLVPIASGQGHPGTIFIHQTNAVLWVGRLKPGEVVKLPRAPFVYLYVAQGSAELEQAETLSTGDAARLTNASPLTLTASSEAGAEVLVWEMGGE
jgi:redox-sensitive bicupin YhaK (pirin superfamily)